MPTLGLALALAVIALGLLPDLEQALYLTAVGLALFSAAITLFAAVFEQRRPAAPGPG